MVLHDRLSGLICPPRRSNYCGARLAIAGLVGGMVAWADVAIADGARKQLRPVTACSYKAIKRGVVADVLSATSLRLADGKVLQLQSVLAPTVVDVVGGAPEWPIAQAAHDAVRLHLAGKNVSYAIAGRRPDRYGRFSANVWLAETQIGSAAVQRPLRTKTSGTTAPSRWVQRWMLVEGHARFAPHRDRSACADDLASAERRARARRAGLWALDAYRVRPAWKARELSQFRNTFQIVEGTVRKVSDVRGRVFINFGRDWRRDFTAAVSKRQMRYFQRTGRDLSDLAGRRVEVRGWIDYRGGPYIEVEHTHQLRRIDEASRSRRPTLRPGRNTETEVPKDAPSNAAVEPPAR